jgi:hypothetical protein
MAPGEAGEEVQVSVYAGASYPERPRAVHLHGEWHAVAEVLQRWRTPEGIGFQVRTANMLVLNLLYNEGEQRWYAA